MSIWLAFWFGKEGLDELYHVYPLCVLVWENKLIS